MQRNLIIFIVGTTAVGKTRLSLQMANLVNGQIISCDSKQMYRNANILTAKATAQQQKKAKHHMIDCLNLQQTAYNRNKYFKQAMQCIQDIRKRGKVPIVIGGTNYYLETLLYDIPIEASEKDLQNYNNKQEEQKEQKEQSQNSQKKEQIFDKKGLEAMKKLQPLDKFELLKKIDPKMAQKVHQNDQIRVNSFLQKYYLKGVVPSTTYKPYTQQLRSPQTILFWIRNSNKQQQRQLIKKRVHQMLDQEGIKQIMAIFTFLRNNKIKQAGITQTIGYKEFQQFYQSIQQQIDTQQKQYSDIFAYIQNSFQEYSYDEELLRKCESILIKNTVEYSKRQITWIKNRIFQGDHAQNFFILQLQQKEKEIQSLQARFINQVRDKGYQIVSLINQKGFGAVKQNRQVFKQAFDSFATWRKFKCEACNQQVNGQHEWNEHQKSRKHQRNLKYKQKQKIRRQKSQKQLNQNKQNKSLQQKRLVQKQQIEHELINANKKQEQVASKKQQLN